jgi:3-oxoacyl-[acyl-carrier-protein] synthase II
MGTQVAGLCDFDETRHQKRKERRRGTRAGAFAIYCSHEALIDSSLAINDLNRERVGVFLGITEHGNVETEQEIYELHQNQFDTGVWSPHHNPRTVANSPAGEVSLNLNITGPHYTIGAACAGGNAGLIQGIQMLQLGQVDYALAGGISESPQTFGIFAGFNAQGALGFHEQAEMAIRPLDKTRQGTVISEGGCVYVLERLSQAEKRGAKIHGMIIGHAMNSDASDFVNPSPQGQKRCMEMALAHAGIKPKDVDMLSMHATGTQAGDKSETAAIREVFKEEDETFINFSKGHIGHAMGAAGALELAGNLPSFEDGLVHPGRNTLELDPECVMPHLVTDKPVEHGNIEIIVNNSFGMLGINSSVVVKKYRS